MAQITLTFTIKLKRPHLRDMLHSVAKRVVMMTGGLGLETITRWFGWAVMVMCYTEPRIKP